MVEYITMKFQRKNQNGGFLKLIILIIIVLFLIKYLRISFSDVFDWINKLLNFIFKK